MIPRSTRRSTPASNMFIFINLLVILISAGCKKSSSDTFTEGANVYMTGVLGSEAVYWKNGEKFTLTNYTEVTGITVSGQDVYISGQLNTDTIQAAYWKNGVLNTLRTNGISRANGIAISGNDVYCVGNIVDPPNPGRAVYWKNGVLNHLESLSGAEANAVAFSGTNMIVAGHIFQSFDTAVVWSSGLVSWRADPGAMFNAVTTQGNDRWIAGVFSGQAACWKNDSLIILSPNATASSIAISGTDIYVAGSTHDGGYKAVYWKNGIKVPLSSPYTVSYAAGIAVAGNDVYVIGSVTDNAMYIPVYWKNGTMVRLGDSGFGLAICAGK
jgi:hypothetical protein